MLEEYVLFSDNCLHDIVFILLPMLDQSEISLTLQNIY